MTFGTYLASIKRWVWSPLLNKLDIHGTCLWSQHSGRRESQVQGHPQLNSRFASLGYMRPRLSQKWHSIRGRWNFRKLVSFSHQATALSSDRNTALSFLDVLWWDPVYAVLSFSRPGWSERFLLYGLSNSGQITCSRIQNQSPCHANHIFLNCSFKNYSSRTVMSLILTVPSTGLGKLFSVARCLLCVGSRTQALGNSKSCGQWPDPAGQVLWCAEEWGVPRGRWKI